MVGALAAARHRKRCLPAVSWEDPEARGYRYRAAAGEGMAGASAEPDAGGPDGWGKRTDAELLALVRSQPLDSAQRAAACEVLVKRYEHLVRKCVRRYRSPEPEEDLMQTGYVGLLKAINNFDPGRDVGLAAYAQPCISGEIKRHFRDKRWQVHLKRSLQEQVLEVRKTRDSLRQELGKEPGHGDIARAAGLTTDEVLEVGQAELVFQPFSLDAPVSSELGADTLGELTGQEDTAIDQALAMEAIASHWNELPKRQQRILTMRFYGNMTQAEIGQAVGISQMHVSRLLAVALAYLRKCLTASASDQQD
jgi:RNA polymerase sigma-B factor